MAKPDPTTQVNCEFAAFLGVGMIFTDEFRDSPEGVKTQKLLAARLAAGAEPPELEDILRQIAQAAPPGCVRPDALGNL